MRPSHPHPPTRAAFYIALLVLLTTPTPTTAAIVHDGCKSKDWPSCRMSLITSIFNSTSLPLRATPDIIHPMPDYAMRGFPGPGSGERVCAPALASANIEADLRWD